METKGKSPMVLCKKAAQEQRELAACKLFLLEEKGQNLKLAMTKKHYG